MVAGRSIDKAAVGPTVALKISSWRAKAGCKEVEPLCNLRCQLSAISFLFLLTS
jgi:hypothetical protein